MNRVIQCVCEPRPGPHSGCRESSEVCPGNGRLAVALISRVACGIWAPSPSFLVCKRRAITGRPHWVGVRGADRREAQLLALLASPGGSSLSRQGRRQGLRRLCCRGSPSGPRLETPDRSSGHSQPLALWQQGQQALWGETAAACVVTTPAEKLPLDASSRQSLAPRAGSTAVPCMGRGGSDGRDPPSLPFTLQPCRGRVRGCSQHPQET